MKFSLPAAFLLAILYSIPVDAQQPVDGPRLVLVDTIGTNGVTRDVLMPESAPSPEMARIERKAFDILNAAREAAGRPGLVWDESIALLARRHSREMAENNFFSHRGRDGQTVDGRADNSGLRGWRAIGENIAMLRVQVNPAERAAENWLKSAAHKSNILGGSWTASAIGVASAADGTLYFTQVFIMR